MASRSLNVTAIFGGIGGLELGLHRSGHHTSLFCECDPDATAVLARRFPGVPIAPDVRRTAEIVEQIDSGSDLLTAGFPCTDLSQAGRTQGFDGGRSSLIRETIDLLHRREFPHILIENVPNWRMLHKGQYLAEVLGAIEGLGFKWAYRTIDARAFGLPQRRLRIFVYATKDGDPRDVLFQGNEKPDDTEYGLAERAHGFYWTEGNRGLGWGEDCVPTLKGGSSIGVPAPPAVLKTNGDIVTPHINDAERMQGFDAGWTDLGERLPEFGGGPFNQRRRWLLVGNAVNARASEWIGHRLAEPEAYDGCQGEPLSENEPWPLAAWCDGSKRYKADCGVWPTKSGTKDIVELEEMVGDHGSPLSLRATAGFYKRITASSLRTKVGFIEAVARHLARMQTSAERLAHEVEAAQEAA
jgi:DNA (cytosine-5)-methyltransferase 1